MPKPKSRYRLLQLSRKFARLKHPRDLAQLLRVETYRLELLAAQPKYHIFPMKKANGEQRWIEDPEDRLQDVQDAIAFYLGCCYYFHQTAAAYGFVISAKEDRPPRNVATNALCHLGAQWLYNADMKDFFHQIKTVDVFRIFQQRPFGFPDDLADLLARLCTNQGRLPMGAPTSPTLSNWAMVEMDEQLLKLAEWAGWTYTRYADDLSFSSSKAFTNGDRKRIQIIVTDAGFAFNEDKYRLLGPEDPKEVTGVLLGDGEIDIPEDFLQELRQDLQKLRSVVEVAHRMGQREKWIDRFQEQVRGKVAFATFVNGDQDPVSQELNRALFDAMDPPDSFGAQRWVEFGYF